jgi:hypothetical protein
MQVRFLPNILKTKKSDAGEVTLNSVVGTFAVAKEPGRAI